MNKTLLLKASIIGCLIFSTLIGTAQENLKRHTIGISAGFGQGDFIKLTKELGPYSYHGKSLSKYGIHYWYMFERGVVLETGVHYLSQKLDVEHNTFQNPEPNEVFAHKYDLVCVPIGFKVNFLKYLFWNGAALLDFEVENSGGISDQSALGVNLGVGANYFFKNSIGIFVNPQIAYRGLYYFNNQNGRQRYIERNISFGLAYKL